METTTITKASEEEIIKLINTHLPILKGFDSVVADEELGNQEWAVTVTASFADFKELTEDKKIYRVRNGLNCLAFLGVIPEGDYLIDCTW